MCCLRDVSFINVLIVTSDTQHACSIVLGMYHMIYMDPHTLNQPCLLCLMTASWVLGIVTVEFWICFWSEIWVHDPCCDSCSWSGYVECVTWTCYATLTWTYCGCEIGILSASCGSGYGNDCVTWSGND